MEVIPFTGFTFYLNTSMWARLPCLRETFFTEITHTKLYSMNAHTIMEHVNREGVGSDARLLDVN